MKVLELFGGIGACSKALERLGIDYEIADYVEIDKYAVASFNAMHNTNFEPQDITTWDKDIEVDLIMHGSPCQDFSLAGLQAGGDKDSGTRSSLMYETLRIVNKLKPKYVIWENVKNLLSKKHRHNFDAYLETMEELGYTNYYQVLNAKDYGIPQNRERVFTISIRNDIQKEFVFPEKQELKLRLKDMLEDEVDEKYYLSDKMINYVLAINEDGTDNKFANRVNECKINKTPSYAITVRGAGGQQRGSLSNFIIGDGQEELKIKDIKLKIKNATKKGYQEAFEGDSVNLSYPNSTTRRGRVGEQVSQTLQCNDSMGVITINEPRVIGGIGEKKSNGGTQWYQQDRIYDNSVGLSLSTTAQPYYPDKQLKIRKLTPKECWRLMGFDDEDYEKASKVCSNSQLYKQAGNSIVVNVLEAILKELF